MKAYIVWNASKTEGFVTTDLKWARRVHKASSPNVIHDFADFRSEFGWQFCEDWSDADCTMQEVDV